MFFCQIGHTQPIIMLHVAKIRIIKLYYYTFFYYFCTLIVQEEECPKAPLLVKKKNVQNQN